MFVGTKGENGGDMSAKGRNPIGEDRSDVRLTDAQVAEIRQRYAEGGVSQKSLAFEFGVCQQLVSLLVRFERRQKVTAEHAGKRAA